MLFSVQTSENNLPFLNNHFLWSNEKAKLSQLADSKSAYEGAVYKSELFVWKRCDLRDCFTQAVF